MSLIDHSALYYALCTEQVSEMPVPFIEFTGNSSLMSVYEKYWKYGFIISVLIPKRVFKSAAYIGTTLNEEGWFVRGALETDQTCCPASERRI